MKENLKIVDRFTYVRTSWEFKSKKKLNGLLTARMLPCWTDVRTYVVYTRTLGERILLLPFFNRLKYFVSVFYKVENKLASPKVPIKIIPGH